MSETQREESWFGALGVGGDTAPLGGNGGERGDELQADWASAERAPLDSRFLSRQARRIVNADGTAFARTYASFVGARAALGFALLVAQAVAELFGQRPPVLGAMLCVAYGVQAIGLWIAPRVLHRRRTLPALPRLSTAQWFATIGIDLLVFSALHVLATASGLNYVALLVLPVLMAGVLTPRTLALATAATVALMLLGTAWLSVLAGGEITVPMTQAGLLGSGFFVITLLAGELAGRLAREELTARGSLELARLQAQLNRLVIEEMQDGVLVVDRKGRVRTANPAARSLLAPGGHGQAAPFQLRGVEAWEELVNAVERAFAESSWPEAGREVTLRFSPGLTRTLRLRVRFTRRRDAPASEEYCVLFIEDLRVLQARTRQEKLAAMGRVSAGIAHEIRNPLAAIAQANALLGEELSEAGQRQLSRMVSDNVERLKRIVDDVMQVAPGAPASPVCIDATGQVAQLCDEWARTAQLVRGADSALVVDVPEAPLGIVFDAEHLRRVLVNLLDNARRHGGGQPGSIHVWLAARDDGEALLSVASGGEPIAPDIERFLFEPFFSTRSRGTGLGLYICRELCERYGASIEYRSQPEQETLRNEFLITLRRDSLPVEVAQTLQTLFS